MLENDVPDLDILSPQPFQVIQRRGVQAFCHPAEREDYSNGWAPVKIRARTSLIGELVLNVTISPLGANPTGYPLTPIRFSGTGQLTATVVDGFVEQVVRMPAGGWYTLTVSATDREGANAIAQIGPFGIGEVYVIGGQSHAGNYNEVLKTIADGAGRITTLDTRTGEWRIGHDPQPFNAFPEPPDTPRYWRLRAFEMTMIQHSFSGGTIWPPAMNLLQPALGVPVGMINVSIGGAAMQSWLPETDAFARLVEAARAAGDFRAVLWQQGETDCRNNMDTATYMAIARAVRRNLADALGGRRFDWILARSTYCPVFSEDPVAGAAIRAAIETMARDDEDVVLGPDTDLLRGPHHRAGPNTSEHLTSQGQDAFGALWFGVLLAHISSGRSTQSFL